MAGLKERIAGWPAQFKIGFFVTVGIIGVGVLVLIAMVIMEAMAA
jgi:hypothetical protein